MNHNKNYPEEILKTGIDNLDNLSKKGKMSDSPEYPSRLKCPYYCDDCSKCNTTMIDHEEIRRKQIFLYGLNMFWQEISDNLPKSLERLALGDETIFYAVKRAYMRFVPHIIESEQTRMATEIIDFLNSGRRDASTDTGWSIDLPDVENFIKNKYLPIIKSNK